MHILVKLLATLALFFSASAHATNPQATHPQVEIKTNLGNMVLELYPDKAPKTVENFLRYVKDGYYTGTVFHRVIPGFMIQGGGYDKAFKQKPTRQPIENEAANGLKNEIGTVAMARTSDPHSATAQFFINVANNTFLNHTAPTPQGYGYAVFGKVIEGMDVAKRIATAPTGAGGPFPSDVPNVAVVIEEIKLIPDESLPPSNLPEPLGTNMIKLHTNYGDITLELDSEKAPATVQNFIDYVNSGYYDNTIFHRVIDGFMIQGGGFEPGMIQKQTRAPIENEAGNGLKNDKYTIAMARTSDPHSATGQFFINVKDNDFLNYKSSTPQGFGYCVFGRVVEGMDVVDKIKKIKTGSRSGHQDVPLENVVLEKAEVVDTH